MNIRLLPLKYIVFQLITIAFVLSSAAQVMDIMPNQPNLKYLHADHSNDNLYFLHYYEGQGIQPEIFAFNGTDFNQIPFEEDLWDIYHRGAYGDRDYFVNWDQAINILHEYDGSQLTDYALAEDYDALIHLATFNNKIYFATQIGFEEPDLLTFDGNEIVVSDIPARLSGGGNFLYSETENLLYLRLDDSQEYSLWKYDGTIWTHIPNPNGYELVKIEFEFNNTLILRYIDTSATFDDFHLFAYDGNNLSPITSPTNSYLFDDILGIKQDKLFLRYEDYTTGERSLYEYDGAALQAIETVPEIDAYSYAGEVGGKDYFITYRFDTMVSYLYSLDGTDFVEIPGPPDYSAYFSAGTLNNKVMVVYRDAELRKILVEYIVGSTEATIVPNAPADLDVYRFFPTFSETIFYSYQSDTDLQTLYGFDANGLIEISVPDTFYLLNYEFTMDHNAYFSYHSQVLDELQLFRIDETLAVTEFELPVSDASIFPNPATDHFNVHIPAFNELNYVELRLYTLEGRLVESTYYSQSEIKESLLYSAAHLNSGLYILEIKSNLETIQEKVLKQ